MTGRTRGAVVAESDTANRSSRPPCGMPDGAAGSHVAGAWRGRALVVDSELGVHVTIEVLLDQRGWAVETCATGNDALDRLRGAPYDVVLLGWKLPDSDGTRVARAIRDARNPVPVVLLPGEADARAVAETLRAGADQYVARPFDPDVLDATMVGLVRRARGQVVRPVGVVEVVPERHALVVRGRPVSLRPTALAVAGILVDAQGAVVSRPDMLERVWHLRFDPGTTVLRTAVWQLRDRLGRNERWRLQVVRGVGYRLENDPAAVCPKETHDLTKIRRSNEGR